MIIFCSQSVSRFFVLIRILVVCFRISFIANMTIIISMIIVKMHRTKWNCIPFAFYCLRQHSPCSVSPPVSFVSVIISGPSDWGATTYCLLYRYLVLHIQLLRHFMFSTFLCHFFVSQFDLCYRTWNTATLYNNNIENNAADSIVRHVTGKRRIRLCYRIRQLYTVGRIKSNV